MDAHGLLLGFVARLESNPPMNEHADLIRRLDVNRSQINGWLWRARHAIRKGNAKLACEAMLTALWLMGAE